MCRFSGLCLGPRKRPHRLDHRALRAFVLLSTALLLTATPANAPAEEPHFRIGTFSADITIPIGHRCMGILPRKAERIDDPLQAHGFVLLGPERPIVVAGLDWCELRNGAYDTWRDALAKAAGTTRERVLLSCLHQHDAPVIDTDAQTLLDTVGLSKELCDPDFNDACRRLAADALRDSLRHTKPVTHLGLGEAKVEQVASNRRVVIDGRVTFDRSSSSAANAVLANAPEGEIDPSLKTVSFWNGDTPLLAVHSYAVHPMSFYGRGGVSADFVGLARRRRASDDPDVAQIYLSGCSGDVTAGKYNDGSNAMRPLLADRLYTAMRHAWEATRRVPLTAVGFRSAALDLPYHEGAGFTRAAMETTLRDASAPTADRILAAMGLASLDRIDRRAPIDVPCIDFGPSQLLLLPGESFVGYQLYAQALRPDSFVFCVGYGECWPGYIPTQAAFAAGFDHGWRWCGPESEDRLRAAIDRALVNAQ